MIAPLLDETSKEKSACRPTRCARGGPRALSVSGLRVRLGQDRLSGVRASEALLGGEWHPRPHSLLGQQKNYDFHTRVKVMCYLVPFQSSIDRLYGLCSPMPENRFRCQARGSCRGKIHRHTDQRGACCTTTFGFFWPSGGSQADARAGPPVG